MPSDEFYETKEVKVKERRAISPKANNSESLLKHENGEIPEQPKRSTSRDCDNRDPEALKPVFCYRKRTAAPESIKYRPSTQKNADEDEYTSSSEEYS